MHKGVEMTHLNRPPRFEPAATLRRRQATHLVGAGFEPGYPIYGLAAFDALWLIHAISDPRLLSTSPVLYARGSLPSDDAAKPAAGRGFRVPVRVATIRCDWGTSEHCRGFSLTGGVEPEDRPEVSWRWDRRKVVAYEAHILVEVRVDEAGIGYLQLVPIGYKRVPLPPKEEGFTWAAGLPAEWR